MALLKPILLEPRSSSNWGSCLTIMPNLVSAYRHAYGEIVETIEYGKDSSSVDVLKAAMEVFEKAPSHLIFLDHQKHPLDFFIALDSVYGRRSWPTLIFHVYGDFTLNTPKWKAAQRLLRHKRVQFVCASPRQRQLIAEFVVGGEQRTSVCPFPISRNEFSFDSKLRAEMRARFVRSSDEFLIVYTGRLSAQKNILRTIWEVAQNASKEKIPFRFLLAGSFDDMGHPFFGLHQTPNSYYGGYVKLLENLPEALRARVEYIGQLGKPELRELYNASDLFVSLSTHHDEDYGMSPIEALCCGVPALISDWGGFAGFALDSSVRLLPVRLSPTGATIETKTFGADLQSFYRQSINQTNLDRSIRAEHYSTAFSIEAGSEIVRSLLVEDTPNFRGFTPLLDSHAVLYGKMTSLGRMFVPGKKIDPNYKKFYRHYCSETSR